MLRFAKLFTYSVKLSKESEKDPPLSSMNLIEGGSSNGSGISSGSHIGLSSGESSPLLTDLNDVLLLIIEDCRGHSQNFESSSWFSSLMLNEFLYHNPLDTKPSY